jgi:hypothetical protein
LSWSREPNPQVPPASSLQPTETRLPQLPLNACITVSKLRVGVHVVSV